MGETVSPRALVAPLDSDDKVETRQHKVMERVDWLNHLRRIFNRAAHDPSFHSSSQTITIEALLNTLLESVPTLPLQPAPDFSRRSCVLALSFEEVFSSFEQDFGRAISWDFVLERVMELDHSRRSEDSTGPHSIDVNELVTIARKSTSSPEPTNRLPTEEPHALRHPTYLRIPSTPNSHTSREFSNVQDYAPVDTLALSDEGDDQEASSPLLTSYNRFPRSPDLQMSAKQSQTLSYTVDLVSLVQKLASLRHAKSLLSLSLAGCGLTVVPEGLPVSLRVLNLAENRIKTVSNLEDLRELHLLNLSYNAIESLRGLFRLQNLFELYLAGNSIAKVTKIFQLHNLALLDLAKNRIGLMEGLIDLAQNRHLVVLRLTGNPLYRKLYTQSQVRTALPSVTYLDPPCLTDHSAYRQLGEEAFGRLLLRRPSEASIDQSPSFRLSVDHSQSSLNPSLRSSGVSLYNK